MIKKFFFIGLLATSLFQFQHSFAAAQPNDSQPDYETINQCLTLSMQDLRMFARSKKLADDQKKDIKTALLVMHFAQGQHDKQEFERLVPKVEKIARNFPKKEHGAVRLWANEANTQVSKHLDTNLSQLVLHLAGFHAQVFPELQSHMENILRTKRLHTKFPDVKVTYPNLLDLTQNSSIQMIDFRDMTADPLKKRMFTTMMDVMQDPDGKKGLEMLEANFQLYNWQTRLVPHSPYTKKSYQQLEAEYNAKQAAKGKK